MRNGIYNGKEFRKRRNIPKQSKRLVEIRNAQQSFILVNKLLFTIAKPYLITISKCNCNCNCRKVIVR
jgi:hypothetical protein